MGKIAIQPSQGVAKLLRQRRRELGLSLRDVEQQTKALGRTIHFTTVGKVEQGRLDPGLRRLHLLLRLYHLPIRLAEDLLDLEEFAAELPAQSDFAALYEEGRMHWQAGNLSQGLANLFAIRRQVPRDATSRAERQKALLFFAIGAASLGKYRLSREIVDDLLLEPPVDELVVPSLVQAAVCWHRLGSSEMALGILARAEIRLAPSDHKGRAWVCHERASTFASMGELVRAERAIEEAFEAYAAAGDHYGECQALGVLARVKGDQGNLPGALAAAREARERAESHGFKRLRILRRLDEGNTLFALGEREEGLAALHEALAEAITTQDKLARFYAHYYLWKAYASADDSERAGVELESAKYHVRFVDAALPEADEVRRLRDRKLRGKRLRQVDKRDPP